MPHLRCWKRSGHSVFSRAGVKQILGFQPMIAGFSTDYASRSCSPTAMLPGGYAALFITSRPEVAIHLAFFLSSIGRWTLSVERFPPGKTNGTSSSSPMRCRLCGIYPLLPTTLF